MLMGDGGCRRMVQYLAYFTFLIEEESLHHRYKTYIYNLFAAYFFFLNFIRGKEN